MRAARDATYVISRLQVAAVLACPGLRENRTSAIENRMIIGLHTGSIAEVTRIMRSKELKRYLVRDNTAAVPSVRFSSSVVCEVIYSLLLRSQRQQTHAQAARWLERVQKINPCSERAAIIDWHWDRSTVETEDSRVFSPIISLSVAKEPWESPPPGVSPDVIKQMGGHDIQVVLPQLPYSCARVFVIH